MEWRDRGVVLGARAQGESAAVVELLTAGHGRHLGLVPGARGRRLRPVLQPGNAVEAVWRARLDGQLGAFAVEPVRLRAAAVMARAASLGAVNHLCGLARLLPEREPQPLLHAMLDATLDGLDGGFGDGPDDGRDDRPEGEGALALRLVQFELGMLAALGFGLDLSACAATGGSADLLYVSPRTGRAVSAGAAGVYADRLLPLPAFLRPGGAGAPLAPGDLAAAFRLTAHFLERDVFAPRHGALAEARRRCLAAVLAP